MAKVRRRYKAVGSPVPTKSSTFSERVKHAVVAGIAARYITPVIAHVASLPSRLGVGMDDTPLDSSSKLEPIKAKGIPVAKRLPLPPPPPTRLPKVKVVQPKTMPSVQELRSTTLPSMVKKPPVPVKTPKQTLGQHLAGGLKSFRNKAGTLAKTLAKNALEGLKGDPYEIARNKVNKKGKIRQRTEPIMEELGLDPDADYKFADEGYQMSNREMITPSSQRATKKLSPGRLVMANIRVARGRIVLSNEKIPAQKQPEHPSKTEEGKAFRNAALEALKRANRGDTSALATALGIANLEEPQKQLQAMGQANGVPNPIRGRVDHGTRHERNKVMKLGKFIDNLKGMTPQNPIGMDAEEEFALTPSPARKTPVALSPGQLILKNFRDRNALADRMKRAQSPMPEGMGMANVNIQVSELELDPKVSKKKRKSSKPVRASNNSKCSVCKCDPCECLELCGPSSDRANQVKKELRESKIVKQKREKVIQPMPVPDTRQDNI